MRVLHSNLTRSWWPARCDRPISLQPGEFVRVVDIRNITLIVEPILKP
ncbi:NfeD family protein [Desertifilum tharense]|nr:NfeD family protein [Desertifilum tharense]